MQLTSQYDVGLMSEFDEVKPVELPEEKEAFVTIYVKDDELRYKFGHGTFMEGHLAVILAHLYGSDMFEMLSKLLPEKLDAGKDIVTATISLLKANLTNEHAIVQPAIFGKAEE